MPPETPPLSPPKRLFASRITNGTAVLNDADGRTKWVRRLRDLMGLHIADLGGDDAISEAERAIVRRACVLIVELERMEEQFAMGNGAEPNALLRYHTCSNTLRRLLESVGLQRRARDITPSLHEYIEGGT